VAPRTFFKKHILLNAVDIAAGYGLTEGSEFESLYGQEFSLLHVFQTGSEAHPASYPMGTGCSFPWV
jgi:hypothetical protein